MDDTCNVCHLRYGSLYQLFCALQASISNMEWWREMLTSCGFGQSGLFYLGLLDVNRYRLCGTPCIYAIQSADEVSNQGLYQFSAWAWCSVGQTSEPYVCLTN